MIDKLFKLIVKYRNRWYDKNTDKLIKSKIPLISVGNLSAGGTGKTPFVIELCNALSNVSYMPLVVGIGYKRKYNNDVLALTKDTANVDYIGDEMFNILKRTTAAVIVGKSKSDIVSYLNNIDCDLAKIKCSQNGAIDWNEKYNVNYNLTKIKCSQNGAIDWNEKTEKIIPDIIIIDDGFQHRKLRRDLDIVLIDGATLNKPFLFPKGRLREPFSSLERADIIVLTKNAKESDLQKLFPTTKPIFTTKFSLDKPYLLNAEKNEVNVPKNENVMVCCGIAQPKFFADMLVENDIKIKYSIFYDDHHTYNEQNILYICKKCAEYDCSIVATTEKDVVKLVKYISIFNEHNIKVLVYPLKLEIINIDHIIRMF